MGAASLLVQHPEQAFFGLALCMVLLIIFTLLWVLWQYRRR
jgi:flagellar biogenesis protein FliO